MDRRIAGLAAGLGLCAALIPGTLARADGPSSYKHVFVIVEENHSYQDIIGNHNAPNLNRWASTYGSATGFFGVIHPSEGNYVGLVGGNAYGIEDDALWTNHVVDQPNIVDQFEQAGLSWKGYFENMPYPGYSGKFWDNELYAAKHNGFLNFADINTSSARLQKLVPFEGSPSSASFGADLASGNVPNFSFIVPNQCDDMHGLTQCNNNQVNIQVADSWAAGVVDQIMSSSTWHSGNNAIVVTWDEGVSTQGCCDATPGGGHVPTVVITNNGPRGLQDSTAGNHYSMLATYQQLFGLGCTASYRGVSTPVGFTCDRANVAPLTKLFATGDN